MKIGLLNIDGHNFPNLVLMKLSAYHKQKGDKIVPVSPLFQDCDKIYMSKIFTFTEDTEDVYNCEVVKGGTGYRDYTTVLPDEIEHICPDYSLYNVDNAYGFLTRGCVNKCPWCVVPHKEGKIRPASPISEFISDKKQAILLDNNVLASDFGLSQIEEIIRLGIKVDFNQGLDARIAADNPYILDLLSRVRWINYIRFACDSRSQIEPVIKCIEGLGKRGIKPYRIFIYTLIRDIEDALYRINIFRDLGCAPFAQPYRDFDSKIQPTQAQKDLAHWANKKQILKSCEFADFQPRKGFTCKQYLTAKI